MKYRGHFERAERLIAGGRSGMGSMFKVLAVSEPQPISAGGLGDQEQVQGRRGRVP